jgi:hypothetical protein
MKPPGAVRLTTRIIGCAEPLRQIAMHHRHLKKCGVNTVAGIEVLDARGWPVAWGLLSRASARVLAQDGWMELSRSCVPDGAPPNCASAILGQAARWARGQGQPILTYTLASEPGTSLVGAGWVQVGVTKGEKSWGRTGRDRGDRTGELAARKRRWVPARCIPHALARGWTITETKEP